MTPEEALQEDHRQALAYANRHGVDRLRKLLRQAQHELQSRIRQKESLGHADETFTMVRLRATLHQVAMVTHRLQHGMREALVDAGGQAAQHSTEAVLRYLHAAEKNFRGVGASPLRLDEAGLLEGATHGAQASLLRRIAGDPDHPGHRGVLERYGVATIGHFEEELRRSLVTKTPWQDIKKGLVERSPFLQGAPAHWAERIVRTETMHVQNRASWESIRGADEQLGDMLKILSATFDDRTAADSYAVHGQIRRPEEAFESWFGLYQHPPNRPNDREVVVPHRMSWPLPEYLQPRSDAQVRARWHQEGRKGSPPPRPKMSTVDRSKIGAPEGQQGRGQGRR